MENKVTMTAQEIGEYRKISFSGKLMYGYTQEAKDKLQDLLSQSKGYVMDMGGLDAIDSTGFGVLINFAKLVQSSQRKIVFIVQDELIIELFKIAKFHQVFPIVNNQENALQVLNGTFQSKIGIEEY